MFQIGTYDTYQFVLTEFGRTDFQCRAMCSRVLPFAHLIEKRNQVIYGMPSSNKMFNNWIMSHVIGNLVNHFSVRLSDIMMST